MIYTHILTAYILSDARSTLDRRIIQTGRAWYANRDVYASRYYASLSAGQRVDTIVELPLPPFAVVTGGFVRLEDGKIYRINRIQDREDEDGLPVLWLSLQREDRQYEIVGEPLNGEEADDDDDP